MTTSPDADLTASRKEKFDLGVAMLKGYYDGLETRAERAAVLLVGVVGWLITSATARESLANSWLLFGSAVVCITVFLIMTWSNLAHFLIRFRQIESEVENLQYMESKYFSRYRMPRQIKGIPILYIYFGPILIVYVFVLLLLLNIKFNFLKV